MPTTVRCASILLFFRREKGIVCTGLEYLPIFHLHTAFECLRNRDHGETEHQDKEGVVEKAAHLTAARKVYILSLVNQNTPLLDCHILSCFPPPQPFNHIVLPHLGPRAMESAIYGSRSLKLLPEIFVIVSSNVMEEETKAGNVLKQLVPGAETIVMNWRDTLCSMTGRGGTINGKMVIWSQ
ncbi:uncharacterized protein LOC144377770 [Ictidomys tridecemlineatus]